MKGDDLSLLESAADHAEGSRDQQLNELLQMRRRKFVRARELLLDANVSAFLLVLNPDRLAVLETIKAHELLTRFSVPVTGLVVNRVLPPDADGAFLDARRRQEAPYLEQIDQIFSRLPRVRVPLLPDEINDMETLRRLGRIIVGDDPVR